MIRLKPKNR